MLEKPKIKVFGIVGGVASGKSFVARHFARLGAAVLDADRVGHEVLRQQEVEQAARGRWGDKIFGADGHIIRRALAEIVFAPTAEGRAELEFLERLTHPRIKEQLQNEIAELERQATAPAVVLDAAVLLKAGWNRFCDKIIYVEAPREARLERALDRGWTEEDFARREATQESLGAKRKLADVILDNSGSPEATQAQVERFWHSWTDPSPPK